MKNFVILIFGLPGSGKTVLANKLAQKIGAVHYNADVIREKYNDWDFSVVGRKRQFERMLELSKNTKKQFLILTIYPITAQNVIIEKIPRHIQAAGT